MDESAEAASTFRIRRKVTNFCPLTIEMNPLITFNPPASESLIMEEQTVVECLRVVGLKIWQYDAKADNVLENERLCIPNVVLNWYFYTAYVCFFLFSYFRLSVLWTFDM